MVSSTITLIYMATNTYHTNTYYIVRAIVRKVVRWVFWGIIIVMFGVGIGKLSVILNDNGKPMCDVTVNRDFTWNWNGTAVDLTTCNAPEDIVLDLDGTWEWFNPDL